jgi:hypothetical protein
MATVPSLCAYCNFDAPQAVGAQLGLLLGRPGVARPV